MSENCDLKLLFAVNYSDSCYQAIRAVAQMADVFRVGLTIAHVGRPDHAGTDELRSFFAEADRYEACDRVQLHGNPAAAVADLARAGRYDLILAPRSDRLGLPRLLRRSLRCDLLRSSVTPLWTIDRGLDVLDFRRGFRTVAAFIDNCDDNLMHVQLAASFAARVGAKLRLLTTVPPIEEGALALAVPACTESAIRRIARLLADWSRLPEIDVTTGYPDVEIPRMVAQCGAELLFLSESRSSRGLFFRRMSRAVDRSPCGVVAIPAKLPEGFTWRFAAERPAEVVSSLRVAATAQSSGFAAIRS